jgi:hypothetical protein
MSRRKVKKSPLAKALEKIWRMEGVREPEHVARWLTPEIMAASGRYEPEQIEQFKPGQIVNGGRGKKAPRPKPFKIEWPK